MARRLKAHKPIGYTTQANHKGTEYERKRGGGNERGYTYQWQQESKRYLKENPLCREHEKKGEVVLATEVDHIVPHKGNKKLFWDRNNWQPLCKQCHSRKTARENGIIQ